MPNKHTGTQNERQNGGRWHKTTQKDHPRRMRRNSSCRSRARTVAAAASVSISSLRPCDVLPLSTEVSGARLGGVARHQRVEPLCIATPYRLEQPPPRRTIVQQCAVLPAAAAAAAAAAARPATMARYGGRAFRVIILGRREDHTRYCPEGRRAKRAEKP